MGLGETLKAGAIVAGLALTTQVVTASDATAKEVTTIVHSDGRKETVVMIPGCNTQGTGTTFSPYRNTDENGISCADMTFEERKAYDLANPDTGDNNFINTPEDSPEATEEDTPEDSPEDTEEDTPEDTEEDTPEDTV